MTKRAYALAAYGTWRQAAPDGRLVEAGLLQAMVSRDNGVIIVAATQAAHEPHITVLAIANRLSAHQAPGDIGRARRSGGESQ